MSAADNRRRMEILVRDRLTCHYCQQPGTLHDGPDGQRWHLDHTLARSKGGPDHLDNLVLACATCNIAKSDKPYLDFIATCISKGMRPAPLTHIDQARTTIRNARCSRREASVEAYYAEHLDLSAVDRAWLEEVARGLPLRDLPPLPIPAGLVPEPFGADR